jgi:hypothetical protein
MESGIVARATHLVAAVTAAMAFYNDIVQAATLGPFYGISKEPVIWAKSTA